MSSFDLLPPPPTSSKPLGSLLDVSRIYLYDIGCNSDCSADAALSDNVRDLVRLFTRLPNAMGTFATKWVNRALLDYAPQGKTRIRFSLMPPDKARLLDVRTSPVAERIAAINDFVAAGYEVHLNFSPVILYEGWQADYDALFQQVDDALGPEARAQLAAEVIFLTHNDRLHEVNLRWHPEAEELLWTPALQEPKPSPGRGLNLRYRTGFKGLTVNGYHPDSLTGAQMQAGLEEGFITAAKGQASTNHEVP